MLLFFKVLSLLKDLSDSTKCYSVLHTLLYHRFPCPLVHFRLFVFVTLHSVGLAGACLTVGEDRGMKTVHNLSYKPLDL